MIFHESAAAFPTARQYCLFYHITFLLPLPLFLRPIPSNRILKPDARAAKDIQCTTNRKIQLTAAQFLHQLQILDRPSAAGIRAGYTAPLAQPLHEILVDTALQALVVSSVDQELGAVGLQEAD